MWHHISSVFWHCLAVNVSVFARATINARGPWTKFERYVFKEKKISSAKSEYHDKIIQLCQGSFTIIKRRLLDAEGVMAVVCMEMFGRKWRRPADCWVFPCWEILLSILGCFSLACKLFLSFLPANSPSTSLLWLTVQIPCLRGSPADGPEMRSPCLFAF